jgi:hypothetical protein
MNLSELTVAAVDIAESFEIPHMVVGAIAVAAYAIPRSTKDIDFLVSADPTKGIFQFIKALQPLVEFEAQAQFDTITWGKRYIGTAKTDPPFTIELFETFDDDFVVSEFSRRKKTLVPMLNRELWLPTPEDVIVQKIRWGRSKDLDDAKDVLAVQGTENLDMHYIEKWCEAHKTTDRLKSIISSLPDF